MDTQENKYKDARLGDTESVALWFGTLTEGQKMSACDTPTLASTTTTKTWTEL